jgi:hypothetical protein
MLHSLDQVRCASLPKEALPALVKLRCSDVRVAVTPTLTWVRWPDGNEEAVRILFTIKGAKLYVERDGIVYPLGGYLPATDVPPVQTFEPLAACITPAPLGAEPVDSPPLEPLRLTLVPDQHQRRTTAMLCNLATLKEWVKSPAVSHLLLDSLRAARCRDLVLLIGKRLPLLASCTRLCGSEVLVPIGYRTEPDLPESLARAALGVAAEEILVLTDRGGDIVPKRVLQPMSRIGVCQAIAEPS